MLGAKAILRLNKWQNNTKGKSNNMVKKIKKMPCCKVKNSKGSSK